jgi:hypothetical protein
MILPAKNPSDLQYLTHGNAAASRSMLERRNSMVGLRPPKTKARAEGGGGEGRKASGLHLCLYSAIATASVWHKVAGETQRRRAKRPFLPIVDQKTSYACTRTVRGAWKPPSKKKKSSLGKAQRAVQCSAVCQAHIRSRCSNPWPWLSSAMPMRIL